MHINMQGEVKVLRAASNIKRKGSHCDKQPPSEKLTKRAVLLHL